MPSKSKMDTVLVDRHAPPPPTQATPASKHPSATIGTTPVDGSAPYKHKYKHKSKPKIKSDEPKANTTLFVHTIPYSVTSEQLETHFSTIGPIRSCFVVAARTDVNGNVPAGQVNAGYGFVTFSLAEDAARALEELKKTPLAGRVIKMKYAASKDDLERSKTEQATAETKPKPRKVKSEDADAKPSKAKKDSTQKSKTEAKAEVKADAKAETETETNSARARKSNLLRLKGIPEGVNAKQLFKKVRKVGEVEKVLSCENGVARVKMSSVDDAFKAAKALDNHIFKGVTITARVEHIAPENGDDTSVYRPRQKRLIIRNLPWNVTAADIENFVTRNDLPAPMTITIPDKTKEAKSRGFAFMAFATEELAKQAMETLNGRKLAGRMVAIDISVPKEQWQKEQEAAKAAAPAAAEPAPKVEKAGVDADTDADDVAMDVDEAHATDAESEAEAENDEDEETASDADEDEAMKDDMAPSTSTVTKPATCNDHVNINVDNGTTVFVRNLSFETTREELAQAFSCFGAVQYARMTLDRVTGNPKGTGFVAFADLSGVEQCIAANAAAHTIYLKWKREQEALVSANPAESDRKGDTKPQKYKSLLTDIVEDKLVPAEVRPFLLANRFLHVMPAVRPEKAAALSLDAKALESEKDRRNVYLIREGVIFPNSDAAADTPPAELEKRQRNYAERKILLKKNPNMYVSRSRLSLQNLDPRLTDRQLKQLVVFAVYRYQIEIAAGQRAPLEAHVAKEYETDKAAAKTKAIIDKIVALNGLVTEESENLKRRMMMMLVQSAHIIRDRPGPDAKVPEGTPAKKALALYGRSKGFGFVQVNDHPSAICALRWLNNNPDAYTLFQAECDAILALSEKSMDNAKLSAADRARAKGVAEKLRSEPRLSSQRRPIVEFSIENALINKNHHEKAQRQSLQATQLNALSKLKARVGEQQQQQQPSQQKRKATEAAAVSRLAKRAAKGLSTEEQAANDAVQTRSAAAAKAAPVPAAKAAADTAAAPAAAAKTPSTTPAPVPKQVRQKTKADKEEERSESVFTSLVQRFRANMFGGDAAASAPAGAKSTTLPVVPLPGAKSAAGAKKAKWYE